MITYIRDKTPMQHTWLRKPAVLAKIGCGTTKLYAAMRYADFPAPVKFGRASVWSEEEIDAWMAEQMAKRDEARAGTTARETGENRQRQGHRGRR